MQEHFTRGGIYANKGDLEHALKDLEQVISLDPKDARPYGKIAWIRSTSSDPSFRDGNVGNHHGNQSLRIHRMEKP